jgi:hypothetical protein
MARAPVSKTGGWGFESLHSCHDFPRVALFLDNPGAQGRLRPVPGWPQVKPQSKAAAIGQVSAP